MRQVVSACAIMKGLPSEPEKFAPGPEPKAPSDRPQVSALLRSLTYWTMAPGAKP